AGLDQLLEPEHGRAVLAGGDRDRERRPDAGQPRVVFRWPHGLLQPSEVESLEPPADANGVLDRPGAVRVEHELDAVTDRLPRGGDRLDVGLMELFAVWPCLTAADTACRTWAGVS